MNHYLFNIIFSLSKNIYIAKIALFLSYFFIYIVIGILLAWSIFFAKRKMYDFSLFILTGFFSWIVAFLLKNIFQISRPYIQESIVPLFRDGGYSLPSEHATVFSALAVACYFINKKLGYLFIFFALMIGLSRVIIGVHYPLDILFGYFVGILVSVLIISKIFKKI